jgi:hypothetical protein
LRRPDIGEAQTAFSVVIDPILSRIKSFHIAIEGDLSKFDRQVLEATILDLAAGTFDPSPLYIS